MGVFARRLTTALLALVPLLLAAAELAAQGPSGGVPQGPTVLRVFTLRHRKAEEAALLIRPFLTENGTVTLQSKLNTLALRDSATAVERAAQAIASWDVPPRGVEISVTLLSASTDARKGTEKRNVSDTIAGVGEQLRNRFNFTDYQKLDSVVVQGIEGDAVAYAIGGSFRLEFLVDPSSDDSTIRLRNLILSRIRRDKEGRETKRDVLRTSINLQLAHTYICGIGKDEAGSDALILVFYANFRSSGPGIVGVR